MRGYLTLLPEEMDALIGLSHEAFRLYVYLRQFMQRSSGEAFGRGVSWPEIASHGLYLAPRSGVQGTGRPDDRKMHRVRDELIRAGALENVGDHKTHLRFRFPIFIQNRDVYFSVQKQAAPLPQVYTAPSPQAEKPINSIVYAGIDQQAAGGKNVQAAPYTEYRSYIHTDRESPRFSLSVAWRPSATFVDLTRLSMLDIQGEHQQFYGETLAEFLLFWTGDEAAERYPLRMERTQSEWERGLLAQLHATRAHPKARQSPSKPSRPFRVVTKQDALRAKNKQVFDNWIPPELREGVIA